MANLAIRTEQLTRDFATVRAVDHLSLSVVAGSVFGLLGPSGAGKSTTIRLLLGLLEPTSGSAAVLGFDVRSEADAIRAHTGSLLEAYRPPRATQRRGKPRFLCVGSGTFRLLTTLRGRVSF